MTTQNLTNITDHPKIAVSSAEYDRIRENLTYFAGSYPQIEYKDSNGTQKKRDFNHLPIGRTASKKIASLVFNEQAEIKVDDSKADEFVQQQLQNDRFIKNFERYLESCLALGGLAMRPYVDKDKVRVAFIQAPVFLPLQSNTQDVSSAAIITKTTKSEGNKHKYYTLIELHEWGKDDKYTVTNELYKSDNKQVVGARVPLSELYEDLEEVADLKRLSRPLFTYLKTPGMNNKDINSPLGLSIFDNAKTTIDFLNTTYDEFMWEVKMGQRRVAVPTQMIKTEYNQDGDKVTIKREFEPGQNVYEQFDSGDLDKGIGITDLTTAIRSDDYIKAINEGLKLFEMQIGVSSGTFTFDGKSLKTATEVVSENSDTYQMRNSIVSLVEQSLKELIISMLELGKAYGLYKGNIPDMEKISINLDDGVFTDRNAELDYWVKVVNAGFATDVMAIEKVLNVTPEKARKIKAEISGNAISEANDGRSDEDVEIYGN
ncbi:Phage minor capsid protein [Streptococcus oralis]|uniref:Phage minor capsid protein n=2 Tax=Streptococcus oralis TaxID=1303 RepID=A0A139RN94_STROR|nr:phage portal protein [Streptococcus oralis]KXU16204.1 Phage minor capsid protein [Streptococcus oralis]